MAHVSIHVVANVRICGVIWYKEKEFQFVFHPAIIYTQACKKIKGYKVSLANTIFYTKLYSSQFPSTNVLRLRGTILGVNRLKWLTT